MATNNNDQNKKQEKEYYSPFKLYHAESVVDQSTMQISYWNQMMKIIFAPLLPNSTPDSPKYDYDNKGVVCINHVQAYMLAQEIATLLQDQELYRNVGIVNTNNGNLLCVSNGVEYGVTTPCLVLRKIGDNGEIVYAYIYQFRDDKYSVRNFDETTKEYDKNFFPTVELELFRDTLIEYYKSMSGALAYSVVDMMKYDTSRVNTKLDSIAEKLGIEYGSKRQYNGNSNAGRRPTGTGSGTMFDSIQDRDISTVDDIKDMM